MNTLMNHLFKHNKKWLTHGDLTVDTPIRFKSYKTATRALIGCSD